MSANAVDAPVEAGREESGTLSDRLLTALFGDRLGLCVFLATVAVFMVVWRVEFTISDNYTLANGLAALADGHLHVAEPLYTPTLDTPGMSIVDGRAYPRNFGQLFFALPFLWALQGLSVLVYPRIGLAAVWSLVILATFVTAGRELGRKQLGNGLGAALALVLFALSFAFYRPLAPDRLVYLALQLSTVALAAFSCVVLYRLGSDMYGRRVGLAAGLGSGLATPTLLWASVPKRHVPMATLVVVTLYLLYRSRAATEASEALRFRVIAYVPVGLATWIHSAEGLTLFVALAIADVLTARRNDLRTLAMVGVALVVSLIPVFLTNFIVAGNPVEPPRMWPNFDPDKLGSAGNGGGAGDGNGAGGPDGADGGTGDGGTGIVVPTAITKALFYVDLLVNGLVAIVTTPMRIYRSFVHTGYVEGGPNLAIDLAYIESMPVVGALLAGPILAARKVRELTMAQPATSTDLFVGVYTVLLTLVYLNRLPIHTQFTVRYLFPLFPLGVYALVRLPWVRTVVRERARLMGVTYAVGVLLGGQLMLASFVMFQTPIDEATQAFAYLSLAIAGVIALWSLLAVYGREHDRIGAVLLGLAGAVTTDFILVLSVYYFQTDAVLPLVPSF